MQSYRALRLMPLGVLISILLSGSWCLSFGQCEEAVMSSGMSQYLKAKFPGWKVVAVSDLLEYHKELWMKEHSTACPGIAQARFDPSGHWKTAILLVPKLPSDNGAKLILVNKTGQKYSSMVLADMNERGQVPVIFAAPRGSYKSWDNSRKVRTQYAVVTLLLRIIGDRFLLGQRQITRTPSLRLTKSILNLVLVKSCLPARACAQPHSAMEPPALIRARLIRTRR